MSKELCDQLRNETVPEGYYTPPQLRPIGAPFQEGLFIFENVCYILFMFTFVFFKYLHPSRNKFSRLQQRPWLYVALTHMGASWVSVNASWYGFRPIDKGVPCWLYVMNYYLAAPCLTFPLVVRLLRFYRDNEWTSTVVLLTVEGDNKQLQQEDAASVDNTRSLASGSVVTWNEVGFSTVIAKIKTSGSSWRALLEVICCHRIRTRHPPINPGSSVAVVDEPVSENGEKPMKGSTLEPNKNIIVEKLQAMKFLKSRFGSRTTMTVVFLPYVLTTIINLAIHPMVIDGCWGCAMSLAQEIVLIVETVFALGLVVLCYHINRTKKDPFGIVQEVRWAIRYGGIPATLSLILNAAFRTTLLMDSDFSFTMLIEIFLVVYCFIQSGLQCILAMVDLSSEQSAMAKTAFTIKEFESQFLRKSGQYHDAFAKHLASEHGYESLAFLLDVFQWEKEYFDVNAKTTRSRAKKIVNRYVGDTAELPCNLSENCVKSIRHTMQKSEDELKFDFFNIAKWEIIKMLYRDSFRRFVKSSEYKKLAVASAVANSSMINTNV